MKNMIIAALFTFSQIAFAGPSGVDVKAGNQMSGMLFRENHSLNAGFEANNENNVTDSSGIATVTSTSPISGNYSLAIDATTSGELVKILGKTIKQVGTSCESVFYYTGDATLYKAYVLQGATKVSQELTLSNVGTNVQPVSLIFPCGAGTAPDVTIESTGNGAAIKVDDFYSGMPVNIGTVAQAQLLGTLSYATTAGCNWSTSSTSFTNFTADGDCPTPIVTGQITAPGTKVPGFSIASLAPGSLMIVPQATLYKTTTTDSVCSFRLSDGTNTTTATNIYTGAATPFGTSSSYQFTYTTAQSNLTVQFQALSQSGSSTCGIDNGTSPRATSFDVYYFPSSSSGTTAVNMNQLKQPTIQKFTSGSGTYTTPPGVSHIVVRMVGGGGGGNGGGNAGTAGSGTTGGATTFGSSLLTADGGSPGAVLSRGGNGGTYTINSPAIGSGWNGGSGSSGSVASSYVQGGSGAASCFGGQGLGGSFDSAGGGSATNTGAGGGGGGVNSGTNGWGGGGGGSGACILAQINNPSATYSYSVGSAGSGGSAGTSGFVGAAGAAGYIEVTEYYAWNMPIIPQSVISGSSGVTKIIESNLNCDASSSITSQSGGISTIGNRSTTSCALTLTSGFFSSTPYKCTVNANASTVQAMSCTCSSATSCTIYGPSADYDAWVSISGPN